MMYLLDSIVTAFDVLIFGTLVVVVVWIGFFWSPNK
jgi:hypothetical protein